MNCNTYVHNDPFGGTKYISGTTCNGTVGYYYLTIGQSICMDDDRPVVNLNNLQLSGSCLAVTPTPSPTTEPFCFVSGFTYEVIPYQCPNDGLTYYDTYGILKFYSTINGALENSPGLNFVVTNGTEFQTITIPQGQDYVEFVYPKINFFYTNSGCVSTTYPDWYLYTPPTTQCLFNTATPTETPTHTPTNTSTNTSTPTQTTTQTNTPSTTTTLTATPTTTETPTQTPTNTPTNTQTPTQTPAPSCDVSYFIVPTPTPTTTSTQTPTITSTPTITPTQTNTPTNTETPTQTPTNTATPTSTPLYVAWAVSISGDTPWSVCALDCTETYYSYANAGDSPNVGEYMFYDIALTQPVAAGWYRRRCDLPSSLIHTDSNGFIYEGYGTYPCLPYTPTPTPTNTSTQTPTQTQTPSKTPTQTPSQTATKTPTPTQTPSNTATRTQTPTNTPTPTTTPPPNPANISGLIMWFDGSSSSNLSLRNSGGVNYVQQWYNKQTPYSFYDMVQSTAAYQPTYASSGVTWNSSRQNALQTSVAFTGSSSSNSAMTIFIVGTISPSTVGSNRRYIDLDKSGAVKYWKSFAQNGTTGWKVNSEYNGTGAEDDSYYYNTTSGINTGTKSKFVVQQSLGSTGSTMNRFYQVNGVNQTDTWTSISQQSGAQTTFNTINAKMTLMNDWNYDTAALGCEGTIYEVLWYDRILTSSEISAIQLYLNRW
jgi:hypothetical protein